MPVSTAGLLDALLQAGAAGSILVYHSKKGIWAAEESSLRGFK